MTSAYPTSALTIPATPGPVIGSLCTGYGGLDLGLLAALGGGRIAWCADPDPHITQILATRMPGVPNHGDIRHLDWTAIEPVDVLTAGFPCQDISAAGRRAGIEKGARSGLWTDIVAGIRVLRPALVIVENVAALRWRNGGLHRVLGDLAATGYDAAWRSVRACDLGAPHRRERVFLLAWHRGLLEGTAAHPDRARRHLQRIRRHATTRRPLPARSVAIAADSGSLQAQRLRGPGPLAGPPGTTPGPCDQRERHGHPIVDRGAPSTDPHGVGLEELHPRRPGRRHVPAARGSAPADTTRIGHRNQRTPGGQRVSTTTVTAGSSACGRGRTTADATRNRRHQGLSDPARLEGRPDAALSGDADAGTHHTPPVDWGIYAPAIHRWENVLGRHTPHPTELGRHGRPVLAPAFVEHLMGLPPGWVTDLPLPRTAQLRALGNGVIPQHAARVVALLLDDLAVLLDHDAAEAKTA
jgi:DNA (cytosine-5)-methyltransferase 1